MDVMEEQEEEDEMQVDGEEEAPRRPKRSAQRITRYEPEMPDTPAAKTNNNSVRERRPKSPTKSPARRHHQRRRSLGDDDASSTSSVVSSSSDGGDDEDDEKDRRQKKHKKDKNNKKKASKTDVDYDDEYDMAEPLKVLRLLARRTETRSKWREITKSMNTSEIHYGSRWFQPTTPKATADGVEVTDDTLEERFLVKWTDLSFLHCSWETRHDLFEQTEAASLKFSTFERKAYENGGSLLYSPDERNDGDYFDPGFCQVDRILEVVDEENDNANNEHGMIFDKEDPNFDDGTGRQFLVKWINLAYSESTYEFERDLVLNDIEYKPDVEALFQRNQKPTKSAFKTHLEGGAKEYRRLYKILGDKTKLSEANLAKAVEAYQQELQERTYKNGGQLRDYQAEGVSWMMANYVNQRSCILADEMGLGKVRAVE
jgi:hypothetical protein